ncbi:MAG: hypothetical protein ACYCV4_13205 [Dermatophilaceae bacterium]
MADEHLRRAPGSTSGSGLVRVKTMALGAIPAMSCPATWSPLAAHPAIECTKPDGGVVSSSDRTAVIALLTLSQDGLDLPATNSTSPGSSRRGHARPALAGPLTW